MTTSTTSPSEQTGTKLTKDAEYKRWKTWWYKRILGIHDYEKDQEWRRNNEKLRTKYDD
jgi:hypothetical protein